MDQAGQDIIDAAMELVAKRGYTATAIKDIAKRAGMSECTIFRKFKGRKEIVLQAMEQKRWHPGLKPEDFKNETRNLAGDPCQFARIYIKEVMPELVRPSLGLCTPELAEDTRERVLATPLIPKAGVMECLKKVYDKEKLISDDCENTTTMFLSLDFRFIFLRASFGGGLIEIGADEYVVKTVDALTHGTTK